MDEAEKEYKKVSERIAESREAMKVLPPIHYHFVFNLSFGNMIRI